MGRQFLRLALLWLLFFGLAFGLGYPTLNRYDPAATEGVADADFYITLLVAGPKSVPPPWRYRALVPWIAYPVYRLSEGRLGSWDARWFAMLTVNAAFMGGTALLLVAIGSRLVPHLGPAIPLLAALLYLLNFSTANFHLAGLVDSGEAFLFAALTLALMAGRWGLIPLGFFIGTMMRETFTPLAAAFVAGWWLMERAEGCTRRARLGWIGAGIGVGVLSYTLLQSLMESSLILPWELRLGREPGFGFIEGLVTSIASLGVLYTFGWLLPLAILSLSFIPRPLLGAICLASIAATLFGAWAGIEGNLARPLFTIAGPALSIAAAITVGSRLASDPAPAKWVQTGG